MIYSFHYNIITIIIIVYNDNCFYCYYSYFKSALNINSLIELACNLGATT